MPNSSQIPDFTPTRYVRPKLENSGFNPEFLIDRFNLFRACQILGPDWY